MMGNGHDMDYCAFDGYANQYVEHPIKVEVKAPIRLFVVNAGPNIWSSFHIVGTIFDRVLVNGSPKNQLFDLQSVSIGPGDAACVEFTLDEPGTYAAVNHSFGHASHGTMAPLAIQLISWRREHASQGTIAARGRQESSTRVPAPREAQGDAANAAIGDATVPVWLPASIQPRLAALCRGMNRVVDRRYAGRHPSQDAGPSV